MKKINVENLHSDAFTMIGKEWMLVTAKKDDQINTMTASWGGLGILWNKKVAFVFIRPQRYTKEFVDANDILTLSFYDEQYRSALTHLGRVSGKDEDKIKTVNFTPVIEGESAYFKEANTVLVCKKLFAQYLDEQSFIDQSLVNTCYPQKDFHMMYVCEIIDVLEQE